MNTSIQLRSGQRLVCLQIEAPSLKDATLAASEGFGQSISTDLITDVDNHLDTCHFGLQFLQETGEIAGFTLFKHYDDVLCGGGMIIRPAFQGNGLVGKAIEQAQQITGARFLAYRTQSPRMWAAGCKVTRIWTPQPTGFTHPELDAARAKAATLLGVKPTVTPGFYGGALYNEKPTHLNPEIQSWWDAICNFERGDSVLCIGQF